MIWRNFQKALVGGNELDAKAGYKYLAMSLIAGGGSVVGGFLIGDVACALIGFFDNYDTFKEGT